MRRVQCRRADAVRGKRASGHPHAFGLPPAERALSVGDVLLGEVEAHVKRRHLIHLVRVEAEQAYRRGRVGLRGGELGETVDGGRLVRHDHTVQAHCRIGCVGMHDCVDGEPFAMLLEFGDPFGELVDIFLRFLEQVPFDAHVSEEGHGHTQFLRGGAVRGVRRGCAHMFADHFRRHEQRGVALDVGAFHRVDAVGSPNAVGHFEDAEVHAATAGRAAFDFKSWMRGLQISENAIYGERLLVHCRASGAWGDSFGDEFVVIPLDVVDAEFADELVHCAVNVVVGVRIGQVHDLLGTSLHGQTAFGGLQHPVGVCAEQVGIRVDHFRFEPQTEFESLAVHVIGKRLERLVAVGPHVLRNLPISEAGGVVAAGAEPAVVHDEAFHATFHGLVGECGEGVIIVVEVDGFPCVENDRARLGRDVVFSKPVAVHSANVAVEAGCDFVEAFAVGADEPWGGVGLSIGEADFAAEQYFAAADHAAGVWQAFRGEHAVTAPCHVCGVDVAVREAEAFFADAEQQGGIEVWASGHGCFGEAAEGEVLALRGAFAQMVAGGGEDFVGVGRHGECEFDLADFELAFAGVHDFGVLADEAGFVEFAGPDEFHMLFLVFGGDGDGWGLLGFVGHAPVRVSVFFAHDVGFASRHGFGGDVADCELAEQFHAVATHIETGCADPGFGLRGQHARP